MENKPDDKSSGYDPANVAAMIVIVIFGLAVLFWLVWSLLVFKGGILTKLLMLIQIIIGKESFSGVNMQLWDGWVINTVALGILLVFTGGIFFLFRKKKG